jgi:hypothetical protein
MARRLSFSLAGKTLGGEPTKVDRKRLYGWSETVALDDTGAPCELVSVDQTGTLIIPKGGLGLGLLTPEARWVDRSQLKAVTADGAAAELRPSSYDGPIELTERATPEEVLNHSITAVYQLGGADPELAAALGSDIYQFEYLFRSGYGGQRAFLLVNQGVVFMLVGSPNDFELLGFDELATVEAEAETEEAESDDLDFSFM